MNMSLCRRQGKEFEQSYGQGQPLTELSQTALPRKDAKRTGTQIRFLYDKKVFTEGYGPFSFCMPAFWP